MKMVFIQDIFSVQLFHVQNEDGFYPGYFLCSAISCPNHFPQQISFLLCHQKHFSIWDTYYLYILVIWYDTLNLIYENKSSFFPPYEYILSVCVSTNSAK